MTVLTISRLETAEEKIRKLEDGSTEIIQNEESIKSSRERERTENFTLSLIFVLCACIVLFYNEYLLHAIFKTM